MTDQRKTAYCEKCKKEIDCFRECKNCGHKDCTLCRTPTPIHSTPDTSFSEPYSHEWTCPNCGHDVYDEYWNGSKLKPWPLQALN